MKSTGIVRRIDGLGRIVIPKEIRKTHKIGATDPLEIYTDGDRIVLRKYQPDTWTTEELYDALIAAAQDAGHDPVAYLTQARKGAKT